jgi:hypothetical protein
MTLFSTGNRPTKTVQLNDTAGSDGFVIKNSLGFTVLKLDSKGNVKLKGKEIKI